MTVGRDSVISLATVIKQVSYKLFRCENFFYCTGVFLLSGFALFSQTKVEGLLTENLVNPIGIDMIAPRFTWQMISDKRNTEQQDYETKVLSDSSIGGKAIKLRLITQFIFHVKESQYKGKKYSWQVRVG